MTPQNGQVLNLHDANLSFSLVQPGEEKPTEFVVPLIEAQINLEEVIGEDDKFIQYAPKIIEFVQQRFDVTMSVTQTWQYVIAVSSAWADFKKKVEGERKQPSGSTSIPSPSQKKKSSTSTARSQDSLPSENSSTEEKPALSHGSIPTT